MRKFKQNEIDKIPTDWDVTDLDENILDILPGFAFKSEHFNKEKGTPIIRIRDLDKTETESFYQGSYDAQYIVKKGSFLIGMDGEFNIEIWQGPDALLNQRVCKIKSKDTARLNDNYLFFAIKQPLKRIEKTMGQTTVKHLSVKDIRKIKIPLPHLPEQQAISKVLSTVDNSIAIIERESLVLERLKRGVMKELFGRKGWKIVKLGDENLFELIMGQSPPSESYNQDGIGLPFLQGNAEFGEISPSPTVYCSNALKIAKANDVLMSVRAPVGEVNIAKTDCCIGRGIGAIRTKKDVDHHFLFYILKSMTAKLDSISGGSTFKAITKSQLEGFEIALPPLQEQKKISQILSTLDKRLSIQQSKKSKLERIKKSLMNDLLTGKKRVQYE